MDSRGGVAAHPWLLVHHTYVGRLTPRVDGSRGLVRAFATDGRCKGHPPSARYKNARSLATARDESSSCGREPPSPRIWVAAIRARLPELLRSTTSLPCPGASQGCCGDGHEKRLLLAQGWHPLEGRLRGTVHGLWRLLRMEAWHHLSRSHGLKKLCFHVSTAMTVESLAYSKLFSGRTRHWHLWQIYYAHRPVLRPGCRHGSRPESGCRGQHRSSVAGSRVDSSLPGRIQNTNTP